MVNTYTFKTNYSLEEALALGGKLGLSQYKQEGAFVIMYNLEEINNRGLLVFNQETGGFSFQSYGLTKGPTASTDPKLVATTFLASLGLIDETVSCQITYQRKELPNTTFVECHRDWLKAGLPILNFVGVLNIPENLPLSQVALGRTDENMPDDESIINASTGEAGKARPNDFNTTTVAVSSDGRILSVESNLRQISQTTTSGSQDLLTPQQALDQFTNHRAQLSLTIPAGQGVVDWNKVYQNNQAQSKKATITDYVLTYLEKPASVVQDKLVPMYQIRGIAELTSGYRVRFTETVPALKTGLSFLAPQTGRLAGTQTYLAQQENQTIKIGTFTIAPTQPGTGTLTPSPTSTQLVTPQPTPIGSRAGCDTSGLVVFDLPGIGKIGHFNNPSFTHTYVYIPQNFLPISMDEIRNKFFDLVTDQLAIQIYKKRECNTRLSDPIMIPKPHDLQQCTLHIVLDNLESLQRSKHPEHWRMDQLERVKAKLPSVIASIESVGKQAEWANKNDIFPQESREAPGFIYILFHKGGEIVNLPFTPPPGESYIHTDCPYISGGSPFLYLYFQKQTPITIKLNLPITYTDPPFPWQVLAYPDGSLIPTYNLQPTTHNHLYRLYYEYDKEKVLFTEPKEGFVVKREEWEEFIREKLAPQLGLTARETEDLVVEVRNALLETEGSPYLKISFVERSELDEKLPVEITPKPDIFHRIHFLLVPLGEDEIESPEPKINSITRTGFTVIELGASIKIK